MYPYTHLSTRSSIHLLTHKSAPSSLIYVSIPPLIYPPSFIPVPIHSSTHPFTHPPVNPLPFISRIIHPSFLSSTHLTCLPLIHPLSTHLSIFPLTNPSIHSFYLLNHPSSHPHTHSSLCLPFHSSTHSQISLLIHLSVHSSNHPSTHPLTQ